MKDNQLKEIRKSIDSYVSNFRVEGAEDEIKKFHKDEIQQTMLFILYDKYNFGGDKNE